jgi:hypothetical protein
MRDAHSRVNGYWLSEIHLRPARDYSEGFRPPLPGSGGRAEQRGGQVGHRRSTIDKEGKRRFPRPKERNEKPEIIKHKVTWDC